MRASWDRYFLDLAAQVATRATCPRKHVGVVIVRDRNLVVSGYNGSISGAPHCADVGCIVENDHCVRVVHAEMNAIAQAAKNGARVAGATLYSTVFPCWPCFKVLANAGIIRVVYSETYRGDGDHLAQVQRVLDVAKDLDIVIQERTRTVTEETRELAADLAATPRACECKRPIPPHMVGKVDGCAYASRRK